MNLAPHEIAARDQRIAQLAEWVARGGTAIFYDDLEPGGDYECCWCDCPDTPDSPHSTTPGYVCRPACSEQPAVLMYRIVGGQVHGYVLCERHRAGPIDRLVALGLVETVSFAEPWKDPR